MFEVEFLRLDLESRCREDLATDDRRDLKRIQDWQLRSRQEAKKRATEDDVASESGAPRGQSGEGARRRGPRRRRKRKPRAPKTG